MTSLRLADLAQSLDLELKGDPDQPVRGVATLASAGESDISFLANPAYARQLADCRAGAVILHPDAVSRWSGNALVSTNPYAAWARVVAMVHPAPRQTPGIDESAVIAGDAQIDATAHIGPHCHIGAECRIAAGAVIGAGSVVEAGAVIGRDSRLVGRVWIGAGCVIGERVIVHPGAVIGADGFGLAMTDGRWLKVPQTGKVVIGDDCEIGANTTIDRGALEDTVLEEDVRLDNQVQVAHNVRIGAHTAVAGCTGIAGSTRIGRYCMIAGATGIGGHLEICDKVVITAMSTVLDSIDTPGEYGSGIPARPHGRWKRLLVRLGQLEDIARRLARLEKQSS